MSKPDRNSQSQIKKVAFVLCEGPHDTAFLYRLFTARGFTNYKESIGQFPKPIDAFILGALELAEYENMKLMDLRKKPIPHEVLSRGESLLLLYAMGGESKKEERKQLIENILLFKPIDEGALDASHGLDFSIIYFFDANSIGVGKRLNQIETEVRESFKTENFNLSNGGPLQYVKGYNIGCYIFAGDNNLGTLEHIMTPLMEKGNETIFEKARQFLQLKDDNRLNKLQLKLKEDGSIEELRSKKKMKFDENKSKICVAGQLQSSGKSNTVIIKDCDFINLEKINDCGKCREIMDFIEYV